MPAFWEGFVWRVDRELTVMDSVVTYIKSKIEVSLYYIGWVLSSSIAVGAKCMRIESAQIQ